MNENLRQGDGERGEAGEFVSSSSVYIFMCVSEKEKERRGR